LVRGMSPWPGAFTTIAGKTLKVLQTRPIDEAEPAADGTPGRVAIVGKRRVLVRCGRGAIELARAQLEGRRALDAAELVAGRVVRDGDLLGAAPARGAGLAAR